MFKNCTTLEELKKEYHKLVLMYHPDRGGDPEMMKAVNNAYDVFFPKLKNKHTNAKGEMYEKENAETPDYFKDIIEKLMRFEGCYVEIIGCFIWISGDTKPHKDALKELKFRWHSKKECWYLSPPDYKRYGKKDYSMDDIRSMYGSKGFQTQGSMKLEAAI